MTNQIALKQFVEGRMIGLRSSAVPIRHLVEDALAGGGDVTIDFTGVEVTQSFVDELVGQIVLKQGHSVIRNLVFKGCSESTRSILRFVVGDRAEQAALAAH